MTKRLLLVFVCALVVSVLALGNANSEASAGLFDSPVPEPPINDEFNQAIAIEALPFTDYRDTTYATWSPDDPSNCSSNGSVWYTFTPETDTTLKANTSGSNYYTQIAVYSLGPGMLYPIPGQCEEDRTFLASAGTTYYFLIAFCCGSGQDGGGSLVFTVEEVPPPPNDDFANAVPVSGIPFTHSSTVEGATLEPGEPVPECAYNPTGSIWYAFSPSESASVMVDLSDAYWHIYIGVYTGSSVDSLTLVDSDCDWENRLAFQASAGSTYYIQVGGMYYEMAPLEFHLVTPPPPVVDFSYSPSNPSIYDAVEFYQTGWDPAGVGFETCEWDWGDGTTGTGCWPYPTHSYAADGEYLVELVATTYDGRTGSALRTVQVETHDVAITEFRTPTRAEVGDTDRIVIGLSNRESYDENVHLELYKGAPGSYWVLIGSSEDTVPAHKANRTFDFEFSYTFTDEDAAAGKVSFIAEVYLISSPRDAWPVDNVAYSRPTLIKPLH